jgi:hypothetical protein
MNGPITETAGFAPSPVSVTVQPSPSGRSFAVDGTTYTTAQTFTWISGSSHTIATTSPQSGGPGVQYPWNSWSDGGSISHTVTATSAITYTANFTTQYFLTMNAGTGGSVSPGSAWYNSDKVVPISAIASNGHAFNSWTGTGNGSFSGNSSSTTVTMNGPIAETASFGLPELSSKQLTGMTLDDGMVSFSLNGPAGSNYVLQVSADLVNWVNRFVKTIPSSGSITVTEAMAGYSQRYYRAVTNDQEPFVLQPGPLDGKDIWTTSYYSYAPGGSTPGGGLNEYQLRVGGWADSYYSLLEFDLADLPTDATSAVLYLYCFSQSGGGTPMYLDLITQAWDWRTQGTGRDHERLWWADKPTTSLWNDSLPTPASGQWYAVDVTTLYNSWQNGTYPNYGVELRPVLNSNNNFNNFYSSDYADDLSLRPKLVITK